MIGGWIRTACVAGLAITAALGAAAQEARVITGEAAYRERIALSAEVRLRVELRDRSGRQVALADWTPGRAQVPLGFALSAPEGDLALRAMIVDGAQVWTGPGVTIAADQAQGGTLMLTSRPAMGFFTALRCGAETFDFRPDGAGGATLWQEGAPIALRDEPAASGARYTDGAGTEVWDRGGVALVTIAGAELPECTVVAPAARLAEGPWRIEDIAGRGVIDRAETEIAFDGAGRVAGTAGCNRFTGGYSLTGAALRIGPVASTMMACPEAAMDQERRALATLDGVDAVAFDITGALVLMQGDFPVLTARRMED